MCLIVINGLMFISHEGEQYTNVHVNCYVEKKASSILSIPPRHAASSTQASVGSRSQQMVQLATRQNVASTARGAVAPSSVPASQIIGRYS